MDQERPGRTTWLLVTMKGLRAETGTHLKQRQQQAEVSEEGASAVERRVLSSAGCAPPVRAGGSMRGPELVRIGHAHAARAQRASGAT